MATKLHTESRRLYSWWWDSHISPKNSKWLQENLADTDMKVNTIIKLLEEDADSFARRAEMYYKKRPELMKLVEELYRAYRALAEKYDHATGALRQAHRTMAEAFPNQIPLLLSDESPYGSSGNEAEPHTPEAPPPLRALFDPDDLQKDALGLSSELHVIKRNGAYSEPSDSLSSKKGLKQLNEMFAIGDATACTSEGRVRKGLTFHEEEGESHDNKTLKWSREQNQVKEKQDASYVTTDLQQDNSWLTDECQNLKNQIMAEFDHANKAENELQSLKDMISKLISEKDADHMQYRTSLERTSVLEAQLCMTQNELNKLNDEMVSKLENLQSTEELNQSLLLDIEMLTNKANIQEHELNQKEEELEKLRITVEYKHQQCIQAEMALQLKEKLYAQSQEEVNHLTQEIEKGVEKLRDMELCNVDLLNGLCKLKTENGFLCEQNLDANLMIEQLKDKIILLEEKHRILEDEVQVHLGENEILSQELYHIKEDRNDLEGKHQDLMAKKEAVSIHAESLESALKYLQKENFDLKYICEKHEAEKELLMDKLKDMDNVLEKNVILENSLLDASVELEVLRGKIVALENLHESLNGEISIYVLEKNALVSQVEILTQDVDALSNKKILLENSVSDLSVEVECLRSKLKDFEESYQLLSDQKSSVLAERNSLLAQIESLTQNVENHSEKNSFLEKSLYAVSKEVGSLRSKLKDIEESSQSLSDQNSGLLAERNTLLSQVKILTQNVEKLSHKNSFLENSLTDVSSEVRGLRSQLEDIEESCQSLSDQNSGLLDERNNLLSQSEILTKNVEMLSEKNSSLGNSLSDVSTEVGCLRSKLKDSEESCQSLSDQNSGLLAERSTLVSQVEVFCQNMQKLSNKNSFLENSLSDVNSEVGCLRLKLKDFEESCQSLSDQNSGLLDERNSLLSQLEVLTQNVEKLSEKNFLLENSLSDVTTEVGCLRSKLKDSEESCQSLSDQNSGLLAERDTLVSQVAVLTQNAEKLSGKNSFLENSLSDVNSEVGGLRSRLKGFEESCQALSDQNSGLLDEKNNLLSQLEVLTQNVEKLSEKNSFLGNSLSDVSTEVGCLRSKLKDSEESCQFVSDQNAGLLSERDTLVSHVGILTNNVEKLSDKNSFLENSLSDVSSEVRCLRSKLRDFEESCLSLSNQNSSLLSERNTLLSQVVILTQNMEKLLEKNSFLENSLSDVSTEVRCLRSKLNDSKESCQSLSDQNSGLLAERNAFVFQVEVLTQNVEKLSDKNSFLENSLSDVNSEVGCLRSKLKDFEESCQLLSDQNSGLVSERNSLLSQVEILTQSVEKLSHKNSFLENSLTDVSSEVRGLRSKLEDIEESSQLLSDQNSGLLAERINLLSQLETLTKNVEKLLEKNSSLGNSLSDVSTEVGCLRSKLKDSEESCQSLSDQNSGLLAERNNLLSQVEALTKNVEMLSDKNSDFKESCQLLNNQNSGLLSERNTILSQLEILTQNVEKLSGKNSFLENSLSDVSTEVGVLRSKLIDFEDSCRSLRNQNSGLVIERNTLVSQVESITLNMENLENSFVDLKDKNSKLLRENDLMINHVKHLQGLLKLEKEQHETLIQSWKSQLATLENQNFLLRRENQLKEEVIETEQNNLIGFLIGNFILQRSLFDVNERNLALSIESQKNIQACRSADLLISELEQEKLMHIKNIISLSEQNKKLSNEIRLLWNTLIVDKEFGSLDEIQDGVLSDSILGEVKNILNFISEAEHDNQVLHLEISVLVTLLKHTVQDLVSLKLEKCSLERELNIKTEKLLEFGDKKHELLGLNEKLMKDVEARNQREVELETGMKIIRRQLTDLQDAFLMSKHEILNLIEEKRILMEELHNLRQKHNILEEEHIEVLAEAMELDHLCLFFRSLSAERLLELKSFTYDLDSLHFIKNGLDAEIHKLKGKIKVLKLEKTHLRESITCLEEEFRSHLLLSEFDLITATSVCKELNLQRQSMENQLIQKQSQLSETNQEVQSTQRKNLELCRILAGLHLDNEAGKLVKEELEQKISTLAEVVAHRNEEIRCVYQANEMLQGEIDHMCEEVKVHMSREEDLISELQREVDENDRCEVEIEALLSDMQVSTVNAALYTENFHELVLEVSSILQKEMLNMEVTLAKEYVNNLKKNLDDLEGENNRLKADLGVNVSLVTSLWNGIASLEEQIMTMSKPRPLTHHDEEDLSLVPHLHHCGSQPTEGCKGMKVGGVLLLEKLITKVESLQKGIVDIQSHREQELFDASSNLEAATKEIERLKKKELEQRQEVQESQNSVKQLDHDGLNDVEISKGKNGQMMKDIELDQDSSSLPYRSIGSYGLSRINNEEIDDQLWEAAERNCSNQIWKSSTVAMEPDIEPVEEEKSEYPSSELMAEKELSVDKSEIPNGVLMSQQQWTKRVLKRLETDAQRLSDIATNVKDMSKKMENSKMGKLPASFGYDTIKAQLKDVEGAILKLIDTNNKLTTKAEEYHLSDGTGTKSEECGSSTDRRQISEQARKESEKVGKLELELHKIQYILLKLEEEHANRHANVADRRTRTLLRDYIYGRRDGHRQMKKSPFCGCTRPKTKGDN